MAPIHAQLLFLLVAIICIGSVMPYVVGLLYDKQSATYTSIKKTAAVLAILLSVTRVTDMVDSIVVDLMPSETKVLTCQQANIAYYKLTCDGEDYLLSHSNAIPFQETTLNNQTIYLSPLGKVAYLSKPTQD